MVFLLMTLISMGSGKFLFIIRLHKYLLVATSTYGLEEETLDFMASY